MLVSNSKDVGVRNPDQQENNIYYRTYYRNEQNQDKSKRKTYTDLILGTEDSKKDISIQQKPKARQLQQRDKLSTKKQQSSKQ